MNILFLPKPTNIKLISFAIPARSVRQGLQSTG